MKNFGMVLKMVTSLARELEELGTPELLRMGASDEATNAKDPIDGKSFTC